MGIEAKLEFFAETRQSYGRTALMLSGGASFGKYHFGIIKALHEQDLMPKVVCGSSIGSLVLACLCCTPYNEINKWFDGEKVCEHPILGYYAETRFEMLMQIL
jgi:predicted acylesterase/phospholipase RssA